MSDSKKGIIAMVLACLIWGFSGLYYKALEHVPPLEILAHRTFWSFVIFASWLTLKGRLGEVRLALGSPRAVLTVAVAALMISANWFCFIFSIQVGKATEAALGYYIFPLVAVLIGWLVFGERLRPLQWAAVGLAALAVCLLTYGLGVAPWVALVVSSTFGLYGLIKKRLEVGPVVSVTTEVGLLAPLALLFLAIVHTNGQGHFGHSGWESAMLVFSGVLTAIPLMMFSYAARNIRLSTVGLLQYINPTAQFFCAVVVFGEPFGGWHVVAFSLIWLGLALYSISSIAQDRAARR